jgi:dTDP-4-dehydrorhamnose 3,5-epimerase
MRFEALDGSDARLIRPVRHQDARGSFMRTWCRDAFREAGIAFEPVQGNASTTLRRGSLRGMHFQRAPRPDAKVVRVARGRVHDVIVDLRPESGARGRWYATELSAEEGTMLYVPPGFAHGFQTLSDEVQVEYLMGEAYVPELYDGFRHDDPAVAIPWPSAPVDVSDKDLAWPPLAQRLPWLARAPAPARDILEVLDG